MLINRRTYPAAVSFAIVFGAFSYASVLNTLWPQVCWTPRIGGVLVGIAVLMEAYMSAHEEAFESVWAWRLTRKQIYQFVVSILAIFGTFLWAFGDLLPAGSDGMVLGCALPSR